MKKDSGLKRLSRTDLVDIIHRLQHNEVQLKEVNVELHYSVPFGRASGA